MNLENDKRSKPITVEAFRFVQLKSPEMYTGQWSSASLVTHPEPNSSRLLQQAKQLNARQTSNDDFTPFGSLAEVRQLNEPLFNFIFWLRNNRGKLKQESLASKTRAIQVLTAQQRLLVWENLFHQTQVDGAAPLTEAAIRLLQVDHFLNYYRQNVEPGSDLFPIEALQKAAMASVVIPHQLFNTPEQTATAVSSSLDAKSKAILSDQLEVALLNQKIKARTTAIEQIQAAETRYSYDNKQEYAAALQAYQARVEELTQQAERASKSADKSDQTNISNAGTNEVPAIEIDPFLFQPKNTWDDAYLQQQISAESLAIYQLLKTNQHRYMADTRQAISSSISDLHHQKFNLLKKNTVKTLVHQGIHIPLRNRPMNNAYVFKAVPVEGRTGYYSIYATQYHENNDTKLRQVSASIQTSEGLRSSSKTQKPVYETARYTTVQLFKEGIALPNDTSTFSINGSFETDNAAYNSSFQYQQVRPDNLTAAKTPVDDRPQPGQNIPLPNIFGIMGVKIAEFKKVNQTLCCYTEGEVSHIENILAREYKERETRNLIRSELITEKTKERESENLSDTTSTERHEVQSEISLVLQEDQSDSASASASAGGNYNFGTGGINFNVNGSLNTSSSSSSSSSFSESESYAKEITERAMKRLVEKTTSKRTSKMLREFEERNKHGFDNRKGDKHVTGVYRWVDKIYNNDLVNYGKRLMYEFMLPEPARNYKHLLASNTEKEQGQACATAVIEKPLSPTDKGIHRYWDITEHNFDDLVAYYGLEIEEYPVRFIKIARSFSENFYQTGAKAGDENSGKPLHGSQSFDFEIPTDYVCKAFDCRFTAKRHGENEDLFGDLIIGTSSYAFNNESVQIFRRGRTPVTHTISLPFGGTHTVTIPAFDPVEEYLPIAVATQDVGNFAMTIWAECEIKDDAFDQFRAQFFAQMWASYKDMLQGYNDALYENCLQKEQDRAAKAANATPDYGVPSAKARAIEKREIKRLIIEQIMQKYYANYGWSNFPIGRDYYQADSCNNTLNLKTNNFYLNEQLRYARFLEQAFEWEIMAYTFLPYYWNNENDWGDLLNIDAASDHIFKAFLQSGMANIILPVKPGLEKSVAFLLETGKLWQGDGFILDGQDDLYPAIDESLQIEVDQQGNEIEYNDLGEPIPVVEASWETRIPSMLTIVQDYSNPLGDEGLPCFCEEDKSNRIGYSPTIEGYNKLEGLSENP